jgi:hypothetical protein
LQILNDTLLVVTVNAKSIAYKVRQVRQGRRVRRVRLGHLGRRDRQVRQLAAPQLARVLLLDRQGRQVRQGHLNNM